METVFVDYAPKGVQFIYTYKSLAHWGDWGYVGPVTLEERLLHIQEAKKVLGTNIDWISDTMSNDLKHAIGDASNSEFLLDPDGKIVQMRLWSDPEALRQDLAALVGPVDNPTLVSDLDMPEGPPLMEAPTGIVPRIELEGDFNALISVAQVDSSPNPFYAKLRVAAESELLTTGKGRLYLGYFLDPIYDVHWNNDVSPVAYEIDAPEGITLTPARGFGPEVDAPSDSDPREFLLDVDRGNSTEPVPITLHYYGCTDDWCILVSQEYLITWNIDRDGGTQIVNGQMGFGEIDPRMLDQYPE